jgi:hypothetical protein
MSDFLARRAPRAVPFALMLALLASAATPLLGPQEVAAGQPHAPHQSVGSERHGKRARTVTRSIRTMKGIAIPEGQQPGGVPADPYPSTIKINGFKSGEIVDLDLTLHGFEHDIPPDVDILLVKEGANGQAVQAVQVLGDVGDISHDDVAFLTLDDEADQPLPFFEHLSAGRFRPTDYDQEGIDDDSFPAPAPPIGKETTLAAFDGLNPNGTWRLYVVDARNDEGGSIDGWELTLQVKEQGKKKRR